MSTQLRASAFVERRESVSVVKYLFRVKTNGHAKPACPTISEIKRSFRNLGGRLAFIIDQTEPEIRKQTGKMGAVLSFWMEHTLCFEV